MILLRVALLVCVLATSAFCAALARAQAPGSIDAAGCAFYAPAGADPRSIIASPPPPCTKALEKPEGRVSFVLFGGLSATARPGDPLEFSHRQARSDFERIYFRYADGVVLQSPTARDEAVRPMAPNDLYFAVPYRPVPLTEILVQATGFENRLGLAKRARLETRSTNLGYEAGHHLAYGLFGGAIIAMLAYNLLLWWALRYRFILFYCLVGLAMVMFGVFWSGLIRLAIPGLSVNQQIAGNFLSLSLIIAAVPLFLFAFVESNTIPRWLRRVTLAAASIAVIASLLRLLPGAAQRATIDLATYLGLLATMAMIVACVGFALANRSRAVRYFIIAWTIPLGFAAFRTLWGIGAIAADGPLMDVSPFAVMALEMVLSAMGIAARIRTIRDERDDAQAMRAMLQHLADTDPLTGLLNRRAFLEQAHDREGDQRLILIDIDRFKTVNDRFGHEAGDWVLVEIARLLRTNTPEAALVGRLGGEEFAILLPVDGSPDRLGETLILTIAYAPMPIRSKITASAGEASGSSLSEAEWRALYNSADAALYAAKADGRNCLRRDVASVAA
ncbi:diguanylate cyclase [Sphingomonas gilva]|uniref:diguanylate cyclase n=1 Tax=Sphingomonas gilva TaxID=2305907 RepID=A0A396RS55_9SPHN|nr:diguanylate cyclase [Sphingomonas gilva]RHW19350.1 diguanylate cyclase [Sphingomonas gilva]